MALFKSLFKDAPNSKLLHSVSFSFSSKPHSQLRIHAFRKFLHLLAFLLDFVVYIWPLRDAIYIKTKFACALISIWPVELAVKSIRLAEMSTYWEWEAFLRRAQWPHFMAIYSESVFFGLILRSLRGFK